MRRLALILVLLLLPVLAWAQPTPTLAWAHDGLNVTYFEISFDNGVNWQNVGLVYTYTPTWATLPVGAQVFKVRACNASGCSTAVNLTVVVLR